MTEMQRKMLAMVGASEADTKPRDTAGDIEAALCELAEMLAEQEEAIVELAEIVGGEG